jgi:hypothetical protein
MADPANIVKRLRARCQELSSGDGLWYELPAEEAKAFCAELDEAADLIGTLQAANSELYGIVVAVQSRLLRLESGQQEMLEILGMATNL